MLYALVIKKMLHHKCVQHFLDEPGAKMHRLCTIGVSVRTYAIYMHYMQLGIFHI